MNATLTSGVYGAIGDRTTVDEGGMRSGTDLWDELREKIDVGEYRPKLAPDLELKVFRLKWGNDYAILANPRDLLHYRLELWEVDCLPLMDGTRTVKDIVIERFTDSGEMELSGVADLVYQLRIGNFLTDTYEDLMASVKRALEPPSARATARQFARTLSVEWNGANRLVEWNYRHVFRYFFRPWLALSALVAALAGGLAFISLYRSGRFSLSAESAASVSLILLVMDYFLTYMHELGHAVVMTHYGRKVKSAGFMIYFGSPAFFVESSDALLMEREQRLLQSFAGPYTELVIAGAVSAIAWAVPDWALSPILYKFALLNYFVIFLNLVPMLELDGYFILADAIQVPDLRPRSLRFMRYEFWGKIRRRDRFTKQEAGLAAYAILGVLFTIVSVFWSVIFWRSIFGGLVSALWNGGPIGRLLLVALALFIAGPVLRGAIAIARALIRRIRALVAAVRFKLQTSWRVEAAELIDQLPMFDDLPEDVLSDLAGRVELRSFAAGKPVFRQGERPDAFYVVRSGTLHVVEEDPDTGKERVLRVLGRGESFGELGLVDGNARAATVRPVEDSELFIVDEATFDRLLSDTIHLPNFRPTLQAVAELRQIPALASLAGEDLAALLDHGEWVNVAPGATIIEQGDEGDAFYALRAGHVEVIKDGALTATLGPGAYFGEIALLMDVPRTASVIAKTPIRLYRIDREGFDRVVASALRRGTFDPTTAVDRTSQH